MEFTLFLYKAIVGNIIRTFTGRSMVDVNSFTDILVITQNIFVFQFYSYMYSFEMALSIRQKVDEFMNCEDIAMAFLIAHTIKKPPVRLKSFKERPGGVGYQLCWLNSCIQAY